jgi:DNA-binding NarL/FixJ family response regulator
VRVVLGEDLTLLRDGLIRLLTAYGMEVVAAVDNGPDLLRALVMQRPDVAVVDVRLPPGFTDEGLRAAIEARRRQPGLGVLVLSQYVETAYASELIGEDSAGIGYLLKERVGDVRGFLDALRRVAAGGTVLDREVVTQLLAPREGPMDALSSLTAREREVLELMAEGRSNTAIAEALVVTPGAVEKHITNIFAKLGLPACEDDHRRVLAVLAYLRIARHPPGGEGHAIAARS